MNKKATTSQPINELLASRWSPRSFDPDAKVDADQVKALAEAARWAPSCFGAEPWAFVYCDKHSNPEGWERGFSCLAEGNQNWVKTASLLIAAFGQENFDHNDKPNRHHLFDTGAASLSLVLQAETMGLRAHQMGGFDPDKAKEVFAVPDGWTCISMIAVGKQAPAELLEDEGMIGMETAARTRSDLQDKAFVGMWGKGLA